MDQSEYTRFVRAHWYKSGDVGTVPTELFLAALGLAGEAGDVTREIKNLVRGEGSKQRLIEEMGAVLFYFTKIAMLYSISFDRIREINAEKMEIRDAARKTEAGPQPDAKS